MSRPFRFHGTYACVASNTSCLTFGNMSSRPDPFSGSQPPARSRKGRLLRPIGKLSDDRVKGDEIIPGCGVEPRNIERQKSVPTVR